MHDVFYLCVPGVAICSVGLGSAGSVLLARLLTIAMALGVALAPCRAGGLLAQRVARQLAGQRAKALRRVFARPRQALPGGHRQATGGAATALVVIVHLAYPQERIALHRQVADLLSVVVFPYTFHRSGGHRVSSWYRRVVSSRRGKRQPRLQQGQATTERTALQMLRESCASLGGQALQS